ncbi:MAG: RecX family transcriptional regulator [Candidatus Poribacteria bacterium]|nr:RecX family transcriptional regulator [Candidatus Poribacteria bacterium]
MKQKITDIQASPELPSHQQLFLNGAPFLVIHAALIEKFGLRIGLEIDPEAIEKIIAADEVMRAKNHALRLLREAKDNTTADEQETPRPTLKPKIYTKSEMKRHLEREGFSATAIETSITELIRSGHIRDRKYAENWIARRQKSNPRGKTLLKHELVDKGIDKEIAEQVIATVEVEDETKVALEIAQKRAKQYKRLPTHVAKRRLHGFLARRGFGSDIVRQVLEEIF